MKGLAIMPAFDIVKIVLKLFYSLFTVTKDKKKKKKKQSYYGHYGDAFWMLNWCQTQYLIILFNWTVYRNWPKNRIASFGRFWKISVDFDFKYQKITH